MTRQRRHDTLCRLSGGWFCRHAWWPLERAVEQAGAASLHARIAAIDAEVHPERYTLNPTARAAWEADHMRAPA